MPGDGNGHVAQLAQALNLRIGADHDRAGPDGGVEPNDLALTESLHTLDGAPFAHRVDLERALLKLRFLPALAEILTAALDALGIIFVVLDGQAFVGEETLLDSNPPRAGVGVAVTLHTD